MKEQFVTYEIALKLKELGFNEECLAMYINLVLKPVIQKPISGELNYKFKSVRNSVLINAENCSAPLWQQAIDWLREKHNFIVYISSYKKDKHLFAIFTYNDEYLTEVSEWLSTFEEAREQAILKALELINNK